MAMDHSRLHARRHSFIASSRGIAAVIVGIACGVLGFASMATALGVGGYLEYLRSRGEVDLFGIDDSDFDTHKFGVGFVLDSNLAQNRLFNYRLTLGYQYTNREFDEISFGSTTIDLDDIDATGFTLNNTFGLGLSRGSGHRLWLGPAIRLGVDVFDTDNDDIDIVDFMVGGGPAIGLNIHTSHHMTIGLSASYQYLYIREIVDVDLPGLNETESFNGHEHVGSIKLTLFFRTGRDQYQ